MKRNRQEVQRRREEKKVFQGRQVTQRGVQEYTAVAQAKPVTPKGAFQKQLIVAVDYADAVFVGAPAGSGKTFVVMSMVADWLKQKKIKKIILTRPAVGMGRTLGLLPGTMRDKFEPFLLPLVDVLVKRYGQAFYETQLGNKNIEFVPLEYVRGRSFDEESVVICDEFQNTTPEEAYSLMTRMGESSKMFCLGDVTQNDIRGDNGLAWAINFVERHDLSDYAKVVLGTSDDIVRSGFCKAVVKAREKDLHLNK